MDNLGTNLFSANEFDRLLSENSVKPKWIYVHPKIWNGYWSIKKIKVIPKKLFRFLGRVLKNRNIYWLGLPIYWVTGIREVYPELETQYSLGKKWHGDE